MSATKMQEKNRKKLSGWDQAISDAKTRIKGLKRAIETYRERKKAGDPWPGDKKAETAA
jgi:hypothetical protein